MPASAEYSSHSSTGSALKLMLSSSCWGGIWAGRGEDGSGVAGGGVAGRGEVGGRVAGRGEAAWWLSGW